MDVAASSYDAQLRIRRDAEERSVAHQDLGSWMDEMRSKSSGNKANVERKRSETKKNVTAPLVVNSSESTPGERVRGNNYFSQGKYEEAIQCYTRCLSQKESLDSPVVYSNRAMAYLKLKSWNQAEADATSALQIDPLHVKSYQRRCLARLSLGKVRAAMLDVCAAQDSCMAEMEEKDVDSDHLAEIQKLRTKVEKALVVAAIRAPRRKMPITVVST